MLDVTYTTRPQETDAAVIEALDKLDSEIMFEPVEGSIEIHRTTLFDSETILAKPVVGNRSLREMLSADFGYYCYAHTGGETDEWALRNYGYAQGLEYDKSNRPFEPMSIVVRREWLLNNSFNVLRAGHHPVYYEGGAQGVHEDAALQAGFFIVDTFETLLPEHYDVLIDTFAPILPDAMRKSGATGIIAELLKVLGRSWMPFMYVACKSHFTNMTAAPDVFLEQAVRQVDGYKKELENSLARGGSHTVAIRKDLERATATVERMKAFVMPEGGEILIDNHKWRGSLKRAVDEYERSGNGRDRAAHARQLLQLTVKGADK